LIVRKALIIASQVRSGSTFVGESIAYHFEKAFGNVLFGLTKEDFADVTEASSYSEILTKFNSLYLGHQGWVATKIMCAALSVIVREARKADSLKQAFFGPNTHWIVVRRREKVSQAVSLAYARRTGEWHVYNVEPAAPDALHAIRKETEDALRSIVLSDVYLEAFKSLTSSDRVIEVFYEDFVADPTRLVKRIYDVLGLRRPKGGLRYVDLTKIRRQATSAKLESERDFKDWLLENNHSVVAPQAPEPASSGESLQTSPSAKEHSDLRAAIAQEHVGQKRSIRFLAEKYGIDRALVSYWIAQHRYGALEERYPSADELAFLKGRISALQREVEQLKLSCATVSIAGGRE
jgi:LPS sulfotransferase NodH/transposase-like protein